MGGRFSWVRTAITPSTRSASLASMLAIRPLAMREATTQPWARPDTLYSAAYFAAPVTFARPSTREVAMPMYDVRDLLGGLGLAMPPAVGPASCAPAALPQPSVPAAAAAAKTSRRLIFLTMVV